MAGAARSPWRVFALIGSASLLLSLNYSLVFVSYSAFGETFAADPGTLSWALTGYSITMASLLVPAGWLGDRFGRQPVVVAGIALFSVGSALIATAPVVGLLIVGRVLQGAGLALEASAGLAIILDEFPASRRSTAVGAMGAAGGAAATIGPVVGGALVDAIGWRSTFALNVPLGIALVILMRRWLRRDVPLALRGAPDLLGVALLAGGVGSLALGIVKIDSWGLTAPSTAATLLTAVVLLAVLLRRSTRHPDPIIYLPLFADPQFRRGALLTFLLAGSFSGMFLSVIRMLTLGWGMSITAAGGAAAVIPLLGGPLSVVAGRVADRHGPRTVILPGAIIMATALFLLAATLGDERNVVGLWLPVGALYGTGVGFAHAACQAAALRNVPSERLGVGGAMGRIAMEIGGVISVAVSVAVLAGADDIISGVRRVAFMAAVICLVGGAFAIGLPGRASVRQ